MVRGKVVPNVNTPVIQVEDMDGNPVTIPIQNLQSHDNAKPQIDKYGKIPEFVNVSGRGHQMCVQNQPNDTVKVAPFGILKGEQWRVLYAEPTKAYPIPPLMERRRRGDGKFDPEFLLDADQVLDYFEENRKKTVTQTLNPHEAPKHMKMFIANGKIQTYDNLGVPQKKPLEIEEDRKELYQTLRRWIDELETESARRTKIMQQGPRG